MSLARSESRLKHERGRTMALLPDTGNFIFGTFGDSIFVFPLQLSLLCFTYFFFLLCFFFSSLYFLRLTFSVPSPSRLSHGPGCFEAAPTGGRQTPSRSGGPGAAPRGDRPRPPAPACGPARGGEAASCRQ